MPPLWRCVLHAVCVCQIVAMIALGAGRSIHSLTTARRLDVPLTPSSPPARPVEPAPPRSTALSPTSSPGPCSPAMFGAPKSIRTTERRRGAGLDWVCLQNLKLANKPMACNSACSAGELEHLTPLVRVAIFTQIHNEPVERLETWLHHAVVTLQLSPVDVYVILVDCSRSVVDQYHELFPRYGIPDDNVFRATNCHRDVNTWRDSSIHRFLVANAGLFQRQLRAAGYSHMLYAEGDELVLPHPEVPGRSRGVRTEECAPCRGERKRL